MRVTQKRIAAVCLVAVAAACSGQTSVPPVPTMPTPSTDRGGFPGTTTGPYRVSGVVVERTPQGSRPIADAAVNLWVDAGRYGYSYWWANGQVHSDGAGNFQLPNLPPSTVSLQAWKQGYVQQCAVPVFNLESNPANLEVTLIARDNISTDVTSVPASAPGRIVAGRILENAPSGRQPVAGAFVDFEPFMDVVAASTYSDADGRYLLCGLTEGQIGAAGAGSRVTYVSVPRDLVVSNFDIILP